jgi:hypothetical protein
MKVAVMNVAHKVTESKWGVWGLLGLGIILLILNLFSGGDSAPVNLQTDETAVVVIPATPDVVVKAPTAPTIDVDENSEGFFSFVDEGNFWLAMTIILAIILVANLLSHLKKPVAAGAAAGTLPAPYFRSSIVWFIAAVLMVLVGLWGIVPSFLGEGNFITEMEDKIGWTGIILAGVIAITLVVGAVKYMGISGNASAYFFMGVWVLLLFFGIIYLLGGWLAPDATTAIIEAVKNDAESAASSIVETTNGTSSIKWEALLDGKTWTRIALVAIFLLAPVVVIHQYVSKNKLVVLPVALVAMAIMFGSIYKILIEYEPAREVIEDVSGALGAANETVNPWLGETRYADLTTTPDHRLVVANIGPNDTVRVQIPPKFCIVDWKPTSFWLQDHGNASWYDPSGYYLYKVAGGSGLNRTYKFTKSFKEGLRAANTTLSLEIWATCQQP